MQVSSLSTLLLVFVSSAVAAVSPADSGYVNIREKYGAKGDGTTDDTAAFAQAAKDNVRRLFNPRGVYLFSDTVHFSPKRWMLIVLLDITGTAFCAVGPLQPFLSQNCLKCHGQEKQKGDFRLTDVEGHVVKEIFA